MPRPPVNAIHQATSAAWQAWARSDIGRLRRDNEDAWVALLDPPGPVFAVFDGLGGEPRGRDAAHAAAAALESGLRAGLPPAEILPFLNQAVMRSGGKTTAAIYLAAADELLTVGDSAVYRLEDGAARRWNPLDRAGRHVVTDCLGDPGMQGHRQGLALGPGETVLLCSDGVDEVVGAERLVPVLRAEPAVIPAALDRLLEAVDAAGAPDNATVVVARRRPGSGTVGTPP